MAYKKFTDLFSGIAGTPALKQSLEQRVKTYADTFEKWVDAFDRVCPMRSIIDIDNQNMLPRADEIIRIAEQIGSIQSAADDAPQAIEHVDAIIREISAIATTVHAAVDQQNSAVASIAEGVSRALGEARIGAEAMSRVADVTADVRSTASGIKDLADSLTLEAEGPGSPGPPIPQRRPGSLVLLQGLQSGPR
jgi:methyl-accepting chemotaxis protein